MIQNLAQQNCLHHTTREAAARCPECRFFFCRECITEHDDRVICANCLKAIVKTSEAQPGPLRFLRPVALGLGGILTAWLFFFWIGQGLLSISAEFHDGTVWKTGFWNE